MEGTSARHQRLQRVPWQLIGETVTVVVSADSVVVENAGEKWPAMRSSPAVAGAASAQPSDGGACGRDRGVTAYRCLLTCPLAESTKHWLRRLVMIDPPTSGLLTRLHLTAIRDQLDSLLDEASRAQMMLREALLFLTER